MTALCSGGSSHPKAGVAETVIYSAAALSALLVETGNIWARIAAPLLDIIAYDSISLCSNDPPAIPTFTNAETTAILQLDLGADFVSGIAKLRDLVLNAIWFDLCECVTGPQPVEPPPPPQPVDVVSTVPTQSCGSIASGVNTSSIGDGVHTWTDLIGQSDVNPIGTTRSVFTPNVLPAGCTAINWTSRNDSPTGAGNQYDEDIQIRFYSAPHTFISAVTHQNYAASRVVTTTSAVPSAAATRYAVVGAAASSDGLTRTLSASLTFLCGSSEAGAPATPCCSDPTLAAMLLQVFKQVNLLQRRLAPIAYIDGAIHSGLTGQGSFAIDGLLGVKVHLTTIPASYGLEVGEPTMRFLDSWLSMMTDDGVINERKVQATDTVWTPRLATEATTWGYSFGPGIVATITELEPEP